MQKDLILENLKNRDSERIISQFTNADKYSITFIKHSSDEGVIRNGGRRGACYAPQAILNVFKKFAVHKNNSFCEFEVASTINEKLDFDQSQVTATKKISEIIKQNNSAINIFLGGGHDHIYSAIKALEMIHPNLNFVIVNLDPHLDTRIDTFVSSGTPFRQLDKNSKQNHHLIQIGSECFSNVESSQVKLNQLKQKVYSFEDVLKRTNNFQNNIQFLSQILPECDSSNTIYFLSLDVDAIANRTMEAVSAVNPRGLPISFVEDCFSYFKYNLNTKYFGLYEYNPIFDNLSQKGARSLSALLYKLI